MKANSILLTNGKIVPMTGETEFTGSILIENGKIKKIIRHTLWKESEKESETKAVLGRNGENVRVIDAGGNYILPGFIDAHCHVGIGEEIYQSEGDDVNEMTDPVTPELRAIDGVNPEDLGFHDARMGGVTAVFTCPGSANVIGGTGVVLKTAGRIIEEMILREPAGLKVAFGENPKVVYGEQKKMPMTRMGTAALLRQTLVDAQTYKGKMTEGKKDPDKLPERDLGMEVIGLVLDKKIPLRAHAHRADDIMTAVRIAREFNVDLVLEHCTEGHKIADILAETGYPAIVGPSFVNRAKVELKDKTFRTPGILAQAGIKVAIMTDHSVTPIEQLPLCAALAVKNGMKEEDALKALTIWPAEILGVDGRIGSLAEGKDADLVVWNGRPLDLNSDPVIVVINGQLIKSGQDEIKKQDVE
ncbi:amidohydrolase [Syntrophobotulus glycolicus DSM 8271]|uniref:Amidohydrolase n=1 Tax=Syntrophobotulus glycolicus (strain DSM 8271 / FlGlyR) TaxID=645991 RepID=F0SXA6_SYNGF|nr:amidohydrolase [Syntrophobotulus glycolicus]ADY56966.1 amidohydrolase [Syntrophobotulus glycolicus DSM 8271]